jgi:nucleotide-binding universal stress UspA family protein
MPAEKNILVLTDFSENAKWAEKYALQLAIKAKKNLILYNAYATSPAMPQSGNVVWPHDPSPSIQLRSISNLQSKIYELETELSKVKDPNYKPGIRHLGDEGVLTHKLNEIIAQENIWLVLMGTKGESFAQNILFGSNVFNVLDKINCPVLIIPKYATVEDFEKVGYATDLKSDDLWIIDWLKELTEIFQIELFMINVSDHIVSTDEQASKTMTEEVLLIKSHNPPYINYFKGKNIKDTLNILIEGYHVDILALKHRKYGFFHSLFHSSTSDSMVKHTKIAVLVFPDSKIE